MYVYLQDQERFVKGALMIDYEGVGLVRLSVVFTVGPV